MGSCKNCWMAKKLPLDHCWYCMITGISVPVEPVFCRISITDEAIEKAKEGLYWKLRCESLKKEIDKLREELAARDEVNADLVSLNQNRKEKIELLVNANKALLKEMSSMNEMLERSTEREQVFSHPGLNSVAKMVREGYRPNKIETEIGICGYYFVRIEVPGLIFGGRVCESDYHLVHEFNWFQEQSKQE